MAQTLSLRQAWACPQFRNGFAAVILAMTALLLGAHQGQSVATVLVAYFLIAVADARLAPTANLPRVAHVVPALLLAGLALSATVNPLPSALSIVSVPFLLLAWGIYAGGRLTDTFQRAIPGTAIALALACAGYAAHLGTRPFEGWFHDYNSAATLFNLGIFGALSLATEQRWRKPALTAAGILVVALLYSRSRGGLLTFLVGLAVLAVRERAIVIGLLRTRAKQVGLAALAVLTTGIGFAVLTGMADRMLRLGQDESTSGRWSMWTASIRMYLDGNWLTGHGLGMWMHLYPAYRTTADFESAGHMAHSDFFQTLVEGGPFLFMGLVTFAGIALWLSLNPRVTRRHGYLALGCVVLSAHATFNFPFYNTQLALLVGMYLGIALSGTTRTAIRMPLRPVIMGLIAVAIIPTTWLALERLTYDAAFTMNSVASKWVPRLGTLEVLEALYGKNAERRLSNEPSKTMATLLLMKGAALPSDQNAKRREMLLRAATIYGNAPEGVPGANAPAQAHVFIRGFQVGVFTAAESSAKVRALLAPELPKYPHSNGLRIAWADLLLIEQGYAAAEAYLDAQSAHANSLNWKLKVETWKKANMPKPQVNPSV